VAAAISRAGSARGDFLVEFKAFPRDDRRVDRLGTWLADNINWLKNQLTRRGRAWEDAEDLIQEGIMRVYEYRGRGGEVREPEAVLVRTVSRLAINQRRDSHSELYTRRVLEDLPLVDPGLRPDERVDIEQRLKQVMQVLESVPPRTREIFLLHRLAGSGQEEIARQFGITVSAVEKHVARAVAALVTERLRE
jgi:RNA polymerase sigma factor (sigma-70 family)